MNNKIYFWVTSLYGESKESPRYKLFEQNLERVPSLELKPSINGDNPLEVINQWRNLEKKHDLTFAIKRQQKWGALACYLTKLLYFVEFGYAGGGALCLMEDDVILPKGFEDYVSQVLSFSKENYNNEKIIRLGPFGEVYILPSRARKKVIQFLRIVDQSVDVKFNNSDLCFHYRKGWGKDEIDGYKRIVNEYNPASRGNLARGKPFISEQLVNCLMLFQGNHGDISPSKELHNFSHVLGHWNDPQLKYSKIFDERFIEQITSFYEK